MFGPMLSRADEIEGMIKSVSSDKRKFVISDPNGKDHEFRLADNADVKLQDLRRGDKVHVVYEKKGQTLTAVKVTTFQTTAFKPTSVLLKVYYGTDRAPLIISPRGFLGYARMYVFTLLAFVITLGLIYFAIRRTGRFWKILAGGAAILAIFFCFKETDALLQVQRDEKKPGEWYGTERDEHAFHYGTCAVSIPHDHRMGTLESPSILRLEFQEDPAKHIILQSVDPELIDNFYADMRHTVQGSKRKEAFVFVHGYNVTFPEAARRTAQIAYDLKFDGAPIFFSWPSQGDLLPYTVDENNVDWASAHLKDFLSDIVSRSGASTVHLIAHSMGNRALTEALRSIALEKKSQAPVFREIVLTAPDMDADKFRNQIVPAIKGTARRITLYASSNDEALKLSKKVHGYPRAGDSEPRIVVCEGIDTIDVSAVDTNGIGHSYYGENRSCLSDLFYLFRDGTAPENRAGLLPRKLDGLPYWVFQP
jgi:esterase/lipase superfamily enzyme